MLRIISRIPSQTSRQIGTTKKANPNYRATRWLLSLSRWIPGLFIIYPRAAAAEKAKREHKRRRRRRRERARSGTNRPFYMDGLVVQRQHQQPPCAPHPHPVCVCSWFWYRPTDEGPICSFFRAPRLNALPASQPGRRNREVVWGNFYLLNPQSESSEIAKSIGKRLFQLV